jgi:hypothetical protein
MRCALVLFSNAALEGFSGLQVSRAPGSTVVSSHSSPADLAENHQFPNRNTPGFDGADNANYPSYNYNYIYGNGSPNVRTLFGLTAYPAAGLRKEKQKPKRRVPVTASMAWPNFPSTKMEERSTNRWQHRLKREHPTCTERNKIAQRECGWKGGDSGDSAGE